MGICSNYRKKTEEMKLFLKHLPVDERGLKKLKPESMLLRKISVCEEYD